LIYQSIVYVMMENRNQSLIIKRLLTELDWDCNDQIHHYSSLSRIHWYPASFITAIPGNLIDIFTEEGDVVWDPFCGSGISAIEAFRKGRYFYGTDICRIAIDITTAKINTIKHREELKNFIPVFKDKLKTIIFEKKFGSNLEKYIVKGKRIVFYDELQHWYSKDILEDLLILRAILEEEWISEILRHILKIIFLNITKVACAQQKTWGHIADNVRPKPEQIKKRLYDVFPNFMNRIDQIIDRSHRIHIVSNEGIVKVFAADARTWLPPEPVDLVVTSPPYPYMADYVTSQRLAYYWLGYGKEEIEKDKRNEIGARWQRHNSKKYEIYFQELSTAFDNIIKALKIGGILAIMMPVFDPNDQRTHVINKIYKFLGERLKKFYDIRRHLNELYRWAPFRKLKDETLSIWVKK